MEIRRCAGRMRAGQGAARSWAGMLLWWRWWLPLAPDVLRPFRQLWTCSGHWSEDGRHPQGLLAGTGEFWADSAGASEDER